MKRLFGVVPLGLVATLGAIGGVATILVLVVGPRRPVPPQDPLAPYVKADKVWTVSHSSYRAALVISWLCVSFPGAMLVAAPTFLSEGWIQRAASACRSGQHGSAPCVACGMTRAFCAIGDGRFGDAYGLNRGALPVFLALAANSAVAIGALAITGIDRCRREGKGGYGVCR